MNKKIVTSIPIEFDKQDEGHEYHGPSTWKVMSYFYNKTENNSNIPYKKYEKNKKVLTGPFKGTQLSEKELVEKHFSNIKQYATTIKNLH